MCDKSIPFLSLVLIGKAGGMSGRTARYSAFQHIINVQHISESVLAFVALVASGNQGGVVRMQIPVRLALAIKSPGLASAVCRDG